MTVFWITAWEREKKKSIVFSYYVSPLNENQICPHATHNKVVMDSQGQTNLNHPFLLEQFLLGGVD